MKVTHLLFLINAATAAAPAGPRFLPLKSAVSTGRHKSASLLLLSEKVIGFPWELANLITCRQEYFLVEANNPFVTACDSFLIDVCRDERADGPVAKVSWVVANR